MLKRSLLSAGAVILVVFTTAAQNVTLKSRITSTETMELLKKVDGLFDYSAELTFNISTYDPLRSLDDISNTEAYDQAYLARQKKLLVEDTANSILLNNIGNYYNFFGRYDSAASFFSRSLAHLSPKQFSNDSAAFLSFRGTLKMNLGVENAIADIEQALKINPNDSTAMGIYPLFLINNREFAKAGAACARMLDNSKENPHIPYVFLLSSELFGGLLQKAAEAGDEKTRAKYRATDYNKLLDMTQTEKYATKFKADQRMQNARDLADIFVLTMKVIFFDGIDKPNPVFQYTAADKARLAELEKHFSSPEMETRINPYTRHKALGFVYLLQQQDARAADELRLAIQSLPKEKSNEYFNTGDSYDALLTSFYIRRDTVSERKMLEEKINKEPLGKPYANDRFRMAHHYFLMGDYRQAKAWTEKALQADSSHFNTLRLMAHLLYMDANPSVDYFANKAAQFAQTTTDQYNLVMQFAIYQLINGDAVNAYNNIETGRKSTEGEPCPLCDELISKYLEVKK